MRSSKASVSLIHIWQCVAFQFDDSGVFLDCCCQQNWSGEGSKYVLACRGLPPKVLREGIYQVFDIVMKSFYFHRRARRKQPRDVWSQSSATDKGFHVKPFLWILYISLLWSYPLYWFDTILCCAWDQLWIVNDNMYGLRLLVTQEMLYWFTHHSHHWKCKVIPEKRIEI